VLEGLSNHNLEQPAEYLRVGGIRRNGSRHHHKDARCASFMQEGEARVQARYSGYIKFSMLSSRIFPDWMNPLVPTPTRRFEEPNISAELVLADLHGVVDVLPHAVNENETRSSMQCRLVRVSRRAGGLAAV
jgi:hypothetical protein